MLPRALYFARMDNRHQKRSNSANAAQVDLLGPHRRVGSSGSNVLIELARLLGRATAREFVNSQKAIHLVSDDEGRITTDSISEGEAENV